MKEKLLALSNQLASSLLQHNLKLATAESCTGGGLAYYLTAIAGSSQWFERGFVTYSNEAKQESIQVPKATIDTYGAVSQETAEAMVIGTLENSLADIALSITGVAGPSGGSDAKPVGTVWLAWCKRGGMMRRELHQFAGDRSSVRLQTIEVALNYLIELLES